MSIEYDNDGEIMDMICDTCQGVGDMEGGFIDCIEQFKEDGWLIIPSDGEYTHVCPDCRQKNSNDNMPKEDKI